MEHALFLFVHPFISQSMIVLLYVHLSHGMSIVFLVYPFISWSIFLCIHLYLIIHLFHFYLFYTLLHSYASITSSLFIHFIQYRAVIIGFIVISATQTISSNNRILTIISYYYLL